jgi:hypothetical protein
LESVKSRIERAVRDLLDTIEITGLIEKAQKRLRERSIDSRQVESELAEISETPKRRRVQVSDEALGYLAEHRKGAIVRRESQGSLA